MGEDWLHSLFKKSTYFISAPNSGSKRLFFITNEDDPHPKKAQLAKAAATSIEVNRKRVLLRDQR
jgi:hypothetical protein